MKKRKSAPILILLFIFITILGLVMPKLGKNKYTIHYRGNNLEIWRKYVLMYDNAKGHLPHDLYEVYLFYKDEISLKDFPIASYRYLGNSKRKILEKNSAYFLEITYYEYVQDGQHWYVKEKYPQRYGTILLINEQGEIMRENKDTGSVEKVNLSETVNR